MYTKRLYLQAKSPGGPVTPYRTNIKCYFILDYILLFFSCILLDKDAKEKSLERNEIRDVKTTGPELTDFRISVSNA